MSLIFFSQTFHRSYLFITLRVSCLRQQVGSVSPKFSIFLFYTFLTFMLHLYPHHNRYIPQLRQYQSPLTICPTPLSSWILFPSLGYHVQFQISADNSFWCTIYIVNSYINRSNCYLHLHCVWVTVVVIIYVICMH